MRGLAVEPHARTAEVLRANIAAANADVAVAEKAAGARASWALLHVPTRNSAASYLQPAEEERDLDHFLFLPGQSPARDAGPVAAECASTCRADAGCGGFSLPCRLHPWCTPGERLHPWRRLHPWCEQEVSNRTGASGLWVRGEDRGPHTAQSASAVPVVALDSELAERGLAERVDVLKIHVDGGELACLEGAQRALARTELLVLHLARGHILGRYDLGDLARLLHASGLTFSVGVGEQKRPVDVDGLPALLHEIGEMSLIGERRSPWNLS